MARTELKPTPAGVTLRPAGPDDFDRWMGLYEAVAVEGRWIAGEAPVDREMAARRFARFFDGEQPAVILLAEIDGELVGEVGVYVEWGVAGLGMMVADGWRGRGLGSILIESAVSWARSTGAHKVALSVWPHNLAARRLYAKFGFVEEGRRRRHYRRRGGQLWDAIDMGLVLDETSPGSSFDEADGR